MVDFCGTFFKTNACFIWTLKLKLKSLYPWTWCVKKIFKKSEQLKYYTIIVHRCFDIPMHIKPHKSFWFIFLLGINNLKEANNNDQLRIKLPHPSVCPKTIWRFSKLWRCQENLVYFQEAFWFFREKIRNLTIFDF